MKTIKIEMVDPTGVIVKKLFELNFPEYPEGYEPQKKNRYLLTFDNNQFLINEMGKVIDQLI